MDDLEAHISRWRSVMTDRPVVADHDLDELEEHLRDQVAELRGVGLAADEAFLIGVKRLGELDELSREFARESSGRLWHQLLDPGPDAGERGTTGLVDAVVAAVAAAVVVQTARLASGFPADASSWLVRNASLLVLPLLAAYFVRRRRLRVRHGVVAAVPFVVAAIVINLYPFTDGAATELLVAAHLPVALWFVVGYPYLGGAIGSHERRMDLVRFTGEWFIYYVLLALGGGVLMALAIAILTPTGVVDPDLLAVWVLPSGAAGAVVIAAWLVEAKQRVVENLAPVLTAVFTPLFAILLSAAAVLYAVTGLFATFDRELLGVFDALLVVVLGLVLYGLSARDPLRPPGWADRGQLITVLAALALDLMVLASMLARIGDLGFTPNRTAALGLNLVLLVNLAVTAWLSLRFVTGRGSFHRLERWQTAYLPVFAVWAALVVLVLPPVFAFG